MISSPARRTPRREVQDFVRSGAVDDACRVQPMHRADGFAQRGRARIGIAFQLGGGGGEGGARLSLVPSGFSLADNLMTLRPSAVVARPGT